jgi:hypothetical protein
MDDNSKTYGGLSLSTLKKLRSKQPKAKTFSVSTSNYAYCH